jgi:hypothetical protein
MAPNFDLIPAEVEPLLLPTEHRVITVHRHPIVLIAPAVLLLCDTVALALAAASVIPGGGAVLITTGIFLVLGGYFLYCRIITWLHGYLVITSSRIFLVNWGRRGPLRSFPLADADTMTFKRTLPGGIGGYGTFVLRPLARPRPFTIRYLPYPEQLYLEISGLLFRDR